MYTRKKLSSHPVWLILTFTFHISHVILETQKGLATEMSIMKCVCDGTCERVEESECPWGITMDVCGCCFICARGENEPCGGPAGTCASGLHCKSAETSSSLRGVCTRSPDKCNHTMKMFGCVVQRGHCICDQWSACSQEEESRRTLFETEEACKSHITSTLLFSKHHPKFNSTTLIPSSQSNSKDEKDCNFHDLIYKTGDSWTYDEDCSTCTCHNGISACKPMNCDYLHDCSRVIRPLASSKKGCCPICAECISSSGKLYNDSDTWEEDICTTCTCKNGRKKCHSMTCHTHCLQPKFVEGECCPICSDNSSSVDLMLNNYCPSLLNCETRECEHGVKLDSRGCPSCECNKCPSLVNCAKTCPSGFEEDDGCAICKCIDQVEIVPMKCNDLRKHGDEWFDGCRNCICIHGLEMCSILQCPSVPCDHPIIHHEECCPRCEGDPPVNININGESNTLNCNSLPPSAGGVHLEEDELWTLSSCLNCTCHNRQILCATPTCPLGKCNNQSILKDGCCATCPENKQLPMPTPSHLPNCVSEDDIKTLYGNGKIWKVGKCQTCECTNGQIDCYQEKCLKTECESPLLLKDLCCPICLDFDANNLLRLVNSSKNTKDQLAADKNTNAMDKSILEPHCIIIIIALLFLTLIFILFIVRNWLAKKRRREQRVLKPSSIVIRSSPNALLQSPTPPVTPNSNCCYKYYLNCGKLSEQKTPLCSTVPISQNESFEGGSGTASTNLMEKV